VDEPFTVEEIVTVVENMCMIPEGILIKQPDTHRAQPHSSLSEQTFPRFEDPALRQMLAQEDPALKQMLAQKDQPGPTAGGSTEKFSLHTTPARTKNQLLTAEGQLKMTEEEVIESTYDLR
jgi:hypothetical protein